METQVRTPQSIFVQPQRLLVPLFQRPYVWTERAQWEPLWNDVARVAARAIARPDAAQQPHFLGAVVTQQRQNLLGMMQERTVIDGQQRLTTLQLLLHALSLELAAVGADGPAARVEQLVVNAAPFCSAPEDRHKVWPTNRDQPAFRATMSQSNGGDGVGAVGRLAEAHSYFSERIREWLAAEPDQMADRAVVLEVVLRERLQMVVIELGAEENAQEIFETLNARGAQLTAADLVKNFVFQRLTESGADVEAAYEAHWRRFETGFWETEVNVGRVLQQRSSLFLNQWLTARTGEEVLARDVFQRFKEYASYDSGLPMLELLASLGRSATVYEDFVAASRRLTGPVSRLELFAYRTGVMESEVIKPLVLALLDPDATVVPAAQLETALSAVESWLVRRMLVRATSKSYTQVVAAMIEAIGKSGREYAGDAIVAYLRGQTATNWYWPDDREVRELLVTQPLYKSLSKARLHMLLEAIEDQQRGWTTAASGLGGERVARGGYAIEHVMPQNWRRNWPTDTPAEARDALVHTLGNLTLLTGPLNSKVSDGVWSAPGGGKRAALEQHDVLLLNRRLLTAAGDTWDDARVTARTEQLTSELLLVWPAPPGHQVAVAARTRGHGRRPRLADLLGAGLLQPGDLLYPRPRRHANRTAIVMSDGSLDLDGTRYVAPSPAASAVSGHAVNGWSFWLVNPATQRSLVDLYNELSDDDPSDEGDD